MANPTNTSFTDDALYFVNSSSGSNEFDTMDDPGGGGRKGKQQLPDFNHLAHPCSCTHRSTHTTLDIPYARGRQL